jgi:hypothetical protein
MAFTVTFAPNAGSSIQLNSEFYPIDEGFEVDVEFSNPSVPKLQRPGEWPTFSYPGAATIACEGHIFGASKADFWSKRNAFLVALTPPSTELLVRRHGKLTITDSDAPEGMYAFARILSRVANLENLSPERCPYLAQFKIFTPYMIGVGSGREYLIG